MKWCIDFGWFSNCLLKYTQNQFGGKFHAVGEQNPAVTDIEDETYLV